MPSPKGPVSFTEAQARRFEAGKLIGLMALTDSCRDILHDVMQRQQAVVAAEMERRKHAARVATAA